MLIKFTGTDAATFVPEGSQALMTGTVGGGMRVTVRGPLSLIGIIWAGCDLGIDGEGDTDLFQIVKIEPAAQGAT